MPQNRKKFLVQLGSGILAARNSLWAGVPQGRPVNKSDFTGEGAADDEKFWNRIARKYYPVSTTYINLENGYFGAQPQPVTEAFFKHHTRVCTDLARFGRKEFPELAASVKSQLAAFLQVEPEELIITRNATEALNIAIQGYPFRSGDEVITSQLDYFSMTETFRMLEKRKRVTVKNIQLPLLPKSEAEIVEVYRNAISPQTRVILLTHISNINGLIVPVAEIAAMARERGVDTITDSAHALGQIPFRLRELGSPFVGMNLHKWIGNPVGAGVLYVQRERINELHPLFGDVKAAENDIQKLAHFGTTPFAVLMTIPDSLAFHQLLGIERITQRLHYLKNSWMNSLAELAAFEPVTPAALSCGIAAFRVKNKIQAEVADFLFKQRQILTVRRDLGDEGCIRVTPSVYTRMEEIEKFVAAVKTYAAA